MQTNNILRLSFKTILLFLLFQTSLFSQETTKKAKLQAEFSVSYLWSRCELQNKSGEQYANGMFWGNAGGMIRLIKNLKEKQDFIFGIGYHTTPLAYDYYFEKEKFNLPFDLSSHIPTKIHTLNIPLSYSYSVPLLKKTDFVAELGYNLSIPLILGSIEMRSGYWNATEEKNITHFTETLASSKPTHGIFTSVGFKKSLKKNILKFSIIGNIAIKKQTLGTYTFFPETPASISTGNVRSGFSFIGINLGYIFTRNQN